MQSSVLPYSRQLRGPPIGFSLAEFLHVAGGESRFAFAEIVFLVLCFAFIHANGQRRSAVGFRLKYCSYTLLHGHQEAETR